MKRSIRMLPVLAGATLAVAFAGCGGGTSAPTPVGPPAPLPTGYSLLQSVAGLPAPKGTFSFDIGFVDPNAQQYYLADRSNNGVDVVNTATLTYVATAGVGAFTGLGSAPPGGGPAKNAGPNGIVPVGNGMVFAGDGDSTAKVVNVAVPNTPPVVLQAVNPYTGPALPAGVCGAGPGTPTTGTANQRVDEMAFDPADNIVLTINDASCPPFGTFYSSTAPYKTLGSIAFPTATGGAEQPTWDPTQKKFIMALPSTIANPGGEIDLIDPKTFSITNVFPLTNCNPAGTALGQNEALFLGCAGPSLMTINAATGATISTISSIGGADMVYYNPTANRFYAAASNNTAGPRLAIADGSGNLISSAVTSAGAHSVAVDPATDHVFVPQRVAPNIGISVFGH